MPKKEAVAEYVVTHPHCLDYKVGEVVELTASKAAQLINKIRPVDEVPTGSPAENALQRQVETLTEQIASISLDAARNQAIVEGITAAAGSNKVVAGALEKVIEALPNAPEDDSKNNEPPAE